MRRDLCFIYNDRNVIHVYNAYMEAIRRVFNKVGSGQCFHTIEFGLNFSFTYNMNGGACIVHLMPNGTGTAVDIRYSIGQLVGARYKAHAADLNRCVEGLLGCPALPAEIPVEAFLLPQNRVTSPDDPRVNPTVAAAQAAARVAAEAAAAEAAARAAEQASETPTESPDAEVPPTADAQTSTTGPAAGAPPREFKFCMACGNKLAFSARFCSRCGKPQ